MSIWTLEELQQSPNIVHAENKQDFYFQSRWHVKYLLTSFRNSVVLALAEHSVFIALKMKLIENMSSGLLNAFWMVRCHTNTATQIPF